jgi:hypothetical protein
MSPVRNSRGHRLKLRRYKFCMDCILAAPPNPPAFTSAGDMPPSELEWRSDAVVEETGLTERTFFAWPSVLANAYSAVMTGIIFAGIPLGGEAGKVDPSEP